MQLIQRPYDISSSSKAAGLVETLQGKGPLLFYLPMPLLLNYQWEQLKHY
jgi:hypothetical protein